MMAKYAEQPKDNWKDMSVLLWLKAVGFFCCCCLAGLGSIVNNMSTDVMTQLLDVEAKYLY